MDHMVTIYIYIYIELSFALNGAKTPRGGHTTQARADKRKRAGGVGVCRTRAIHGVKLLLEI